MAPALLAALESEELFKHARFIRDYQVTKQLSDAALAKKFTGIGSTKTFKRILNNDLAELDLDKQLDNYRTVVALIESMPAEDAVAEDLFDDLTPVLHFRRALMETMREVGIARFVLVEGANGCGKSSARKVLLDKFGQRIFWIEANEIWNDKPIAMLGSILSALGKHNHTPSGMARLTDVITLLTQSRRCLIIEEAHHMGPRCLNMVKTLINQTPGEFVLLAIPTLWARLQRAAYEEALQLTGNRMAEHIKLQVRESDLAKILGRRLVWDTGTNEVPKAAVKQLLDLVASKGNLAFVRDVCGRAKAKSDGQPLTMEQFTAAVNEEVASR